MVCTDDGCIYTLPYLVGLCAQALEGLPEEQRNIIAARLSEVYLT